MLWQGKTARTPTSQGVPNPVNPQNQGNGYKLLGVPKKTGTGPRNSPTSNNPYKWVTATLNDGSRLSTFLHLLKSQGENENIGRIRVNRISPQKETVKGLLHNLGVVSSSGTEIRLEKERWVGSKKSKASQPRSQVPLMGGKPFQPFQVLQ